ncbi:hypothetical protein F4780DRAFT_363063 [Xylariomycetidae sp. FL0641]|nr:hypothetical protein F4780DRAFT_363063 [Xylariomycetidae sp. FL0641]
MCAGGFWLPTYLMRACVSEWLPGISVAVPVPARACRWPATSAVPQPYGVWLAAEHASAQRLIRFLLPPTARRRRRSERGEGVGDLSSIAEGRWAR